MTCQKVYDAGIKAYVAILIFKISTRAVTASMIAACLRDTWKNLLNERSFVSLQPQVMILLVEEYDGL